MYFVQNVDQVAGVKFKKAAVEEKLSRPRKHGPALHAVLEKLKQGVRVSELTPEKLQTTLLGLLSEPGLDS